MEETTSSTRGIDDWVYTGAGLDATVKSNISVFEIKLHYFSLVTILTELPYYVRSI
jgi:hypothetical protein